MRPLTLDRPKVLCPVGCTPLIDLALDRLGSVTGSLAVNVHDSQPTLSEHLGGEVEVSVERGERLGTAGALAALRGWIDGRATVVVNGDTWCPGGLPDLVDGWDGERIRILLVGTAKIGPRARIAGALMPWASVRDLEPAPSGLWEVSWRRALEEGRLGTVVHEGPFVDCATPGDYLRANLGAAGGSAVDPTAVVEGTVEQSVVWDGAVVGPSEHLRRAIRTDTGRTVLVRRPHALDDVVSRSPPR